MNRGSSTSASSGRLLTLFAIAAGAALLVLTSFPSPLRAAGNTAPTSVTLAGQLQVSGSRRDPRLLLDASEADPSGWQVKVTVAPTEQEGRVAQLAGQYTLAAKNTPILSGDATGQVDVTNGRGSLALSLPDGSSANVTFSLTSTAGSLTMHLTGNLPVPAQPAAAANDNPLFWYLSRTTGFVGYLLLFVNVCLGLSVRTGFLDESLPRWRSFDLHQFTAFLALGMVVVHVFSLLGDHFIGFSLAQLFVPGADAYRPLWIAVGIVCFYVLVLVVASFYFRRIIGHRAWRALHYLTYAVFFAALAHAVFAGSDAAFWTNVTYFVTGGFVGLLTVARFWGPWAARPAVLSPGQRVRP